MTSAKKVEVVTINPYLICVLCSGYYIEATSIEECLHAFCRSCIVKYLRTNNFCPICDVQLNQSKPWSSLRQDKILQDLVYKLVPGLYQDEMKRRRQFYSRLKGKADVRDGEARGLLLNGARFFSQDDSISLSLEYYSGQDIEEESNDIFSTTFRNMPRRYLQCPAAVTVRHLKKFIRIKYGIGLDCWVEIIYNGERLPTDFSLIDVAYTFTWKRTSPMRFSYRIYCKATITSLKKSFPALRRDDKEEEKQKRQSSLEQQMQNEYLGNFNLNPKNCKTQNHNKTKDNCYNNNNNNNNNNSVKNNNTLKTKSRKEEFKKKEDEKFDEILRENICQSSEESNMSGLKIVSDREESLKENSEDSSEPVKEPIKNKRKPEPLLANFEEDAVDSFPVKKLPKSSKHRDEGKKWKRKFEEKLAEKRRKSASNVDDFEDRNKAFLLSKRRKTVADDFHFESEEEEKTSGANSVLSEKSDVIAVGSLKHEALRKVFISKDKPEGSSKKKDGQFRRKKRKKSKHHEGESKKRKLEILANSPSVMSFAKDPLKLKVKFPPKNPIIETSKEKVDENEERTVKEHHQREERKEAEKREEIVIEEEDEEEDEEEEEEEEEQEDRNGVYEQETQEVPEEGLTERHVENESEEKEKVKKEEEETKEEKLESKFKDHESDSWEKEIKKSEESDSKKLSDKERLLHLRAVRHKNIFNKSSPTDFITAPLSLTISKVDSNEQPPVKNPVVESRPSLEIVLVSPTNSSKEKKIETNSETHKETETKKAETAVKEVRRPEIVDNFGVLDLSEKSTRTKESSSKPSPTKETSEDGGKSKKSAHQSILQIAQTLVNRKLSPNLPENHSRSAFDLSTDSSAAAAAMRNLKTLSDTAVSILMAAQNKNYSMCGGESSKRSFPSSVSPPTQKAVSPPTLKATSPPNISKASKDCENGSNLKIPIFPISRDRTNPIPPVPNLHEIYPRGRGRGMPYGQPLTPVIKPGQNQTVRQIPNPFMVVSRQSAKPSIPFPKPPQSVQNGEGASSKGKLPMIPALQSIKAKLPVPKLADLTEFKDYKEKSSNDFNSELVPKILNNNTKTVQNTSEGSFSGMKNGDEKKGNIKFATPGCFRKVDNMAKNIESVAAGLTAKAVSNMIDAK